MAVTAHGPVLTTQEVSMSRVTVPYPQSTERDLLASASAGAGWPGPE